MLLILLLCASSGWSNVAASLANEPIVKFRAGADAVSKLSFETLQSDEKKKKRARSRRQNRQRKSQARAKKTANLPKQS
jgi:hypothetical protein